MLRFYNTGYTTFVTITIKQGNILTYDCSEWNSPGFKWVAIPYKSGIYSYRYMTIAY